MNEETGFIAAALRDLATSTAVILGAAPAAALACRSAAEFDNHHGVSASVARAANKRIHDSRRRPRRGRRRASSSAAFGSEGELEAMGYQ